MVIITNEQSDIMVQVIAIKNICITCGSSITITLPKMTIKINNGVAAHLKC